MSDMVVIADTHMIRDDDELDRFVAFLRSLAGNTALLYMLGDIFNIWLGSRRLEMPHMVPVLDALRALAREGVGVRYVEGNRDYHIGEGYLNDPFEAVVPVGEERIFGGKRFWLTHGDLVNTKDRQYRLWRRVSKSRLVWSLTKAIPARTGVAIANHLESTLRGTNVRNKSYFPTAACQEYGGALIAQGYDRILLGHIHIEKVMPIEAGGRSGKLIVLPDWRSSHRYLRYGADGSERFVDG